MKILERKHSPKVLSKKSGESNLISVNMCFEDSLLESSKHDRAYTLKWAETEAEKSSDYFASEIYSNS